MTGVEDLLKCWWWWWAVSRIVFEFLEDDKCEEEVWVPAIRSNFDEESSSSNIGRSVVAGDGARGILWGWVRHRGCWQFARQQLVDPGASLLRVAQLPPNLFRPPPGSVCLRRPLHGTTMYKFLMMYMRLIQHFSKKAFVVLPKGQRRAISPVRFFSLILHTAYPFYSLFSTLSSQSVVRNRFLEVTKCRGANYTYHNILTQLHYYR